MSQLLFSERRVLWMDPMGVADYPATAGVQHCCSAMTAALTNVCEQHSGDPFACPDMVVAYSPAFNEYGLIIHHGGPSCLTIGHCPWCGASLGPSRRDEWFDRLEALGVDAPGFAEPEEIPEPYRTAAWWQEGRS